MSQLTLRPCKHAQAVTDSAVARIDLSNHIGKTILVSASLAVHVVMGSATTDATANDFLLPASELIEVIPMVGRDRLCLLAPSGSSPVVYTSLRRDNEVES